MTHAPVGALVSVIMPVYNGEKFLTATLESVVAQTYPQVQVIVVDDGSTDASAAIAKRCSIVRYFYQANQGIAAARNRALEAADGEWIAFLDQDDLWAKEKLEVQVRYLEQHPEHALALSYERLFFQEGFTSPHWLNHKLMHEDHIGLVPGSWLVRKSAFAQVGGLDSSYQIADDVDWFMRFLDAGLSYGVVEETLLFKRLHGDNASFRLPVAIDEILTLFRASIHRRRDSGVKRVSE